MLTLTMTPTPTLMAGIFGGYPELRLFGVSIHNNIFKDDCDGGSSPLASRNEPVAGWRTPRHQLAAVAGTPGQWPIGPSFASCGNGLDLTGVNTLGLGRKGTSLYWGPTTFGSSASSLCYPSQCQLGTAGCFDTPSHCVASTGFTAPAFADAGTHSCSPGPCVIGPHDQGCYDSMAHCLADNPSFTDVTKLRLEVLNNTLHKRAAPRNRALGCPVSGDPDPPPTLCSACDGAYPVDIWQGYNQFACRFSGNDIDWAGHSSIYVHY